MRALVQSSVTGIKSACMATCIKQCTQHSSSLVQALLTGWHPPPPPQVRSLFWSPDDTRVISAGMDGAVYEWKLKVSRWLINRLGNMSMDCCA
jgi:hypothetical protein